MLVPVNITPESPAGRPARTLLEAQRDTMLGGDLEKLALERKRKQAARRPGVLQDQSAKGDVRVGWAEESRSCSPYKSKELGIEEKSSDLHMRRALSKEVAQIVQRKRQRDRDKTANARAIETSPAWAQKLRAETHGAKTRTRRVRFQDDEEPNSQAERGSGSTWTATPTPVDSHRLRYPSLQHGQPHRLQNGAEQSQAQIPRPETRAGRRENDHSMQRNDEEEFETISQCSSQSTRSQSSSRSGRREKTKNNQTKLQQRNAEMAAIMQLCSDKPGNRQSGALY